MHLSDSRRKRHIFLFLSAILIPTVVLITLAMRLARQDAELAEKRMEDERRHLPEPPCGEIPLCDRLATALATLVLTLTRPAAAWAQHDMGAMGGHTHIVIPEGAGYTEADVAFMQGMIAHHGQAIYMSRLAAAHKADPRVLKLAPFDAIVISCAAEEVPAPLWAPDAAPQVEEFRWLLEEYKVSLFAQELKTPFPVSAKDGARLSCGPFWITRWRPSDP